MVYALVGQVKGNGNDNYTTGSMDTTGADLLVACFADAGGAVPTITDSKGNTWVLGRRAVPIDWGSSIYYAWGTGLVVGTGHTFTFTKTDQFGSAQVFAFSGGQIATDPLDQTNQNHALTSTTMQPGSVTPTTDGQLVIAHDTWDNEASMATVDSGFVTPSYGDIGTGGVYLGSGSSYLIQTNAAAVNPTFTLPSTSHQYGVIVTFKAMPPPPAAPTITDGTGGHERVGLQWTEGDATATSWDIDAATAAAPTTWLGAQNTSSTNLYGEYTGLTNDIAYVFRVRGVSASGNGTWSSTSGSVTPSDVRGNFALESGDVFLLESGDKYLLESGTGVEPPNDGSATGAIGWVGSSTGIRIPKGDANGAIGWVGSVTGKKFPSGASSGSISWGGTSVGGNLGIALGAISWVGSSTGVRTPKGAGSGDISWVGSSIGVRAPNGAVNGTIGWGGVAVGGNLGVVTGAIGWDGTVSGSRTPKASASGAIGWDGTADGVTPAVGPKTGEANGAISWVGSATGARSAQGFVSGAIGWAGVAVGGNLGVVLGAIGWSGTVSGTKLPAGEASGAIGWDGTADGVTPAVGINDGSVNGVISWVGSVSGARLPIGDVSGAISWVGIVVGGNLGVVLGAIGWNGTVSGVKTSTGDVSGTISWIGTANGITPTVGIKEGFAAGSIAWGGSVSGAKTSQGDVLGAIGWAGIAVGGNLGVAIGAIMWTGEAQGFTPLIPMKEGSVAGNIVWDGSVIGSIEKRGAVVGAILWIGSATAPFTINPAVFLLFAHLVNHIPRAIIGHSPLVAVGHKPLIPKGRGKE